MTYQEFLVLRCHKECNDEQSRDLAQEIVEQIDEDEQDRFQIDTSCFCYRILIGLKPREKIKHYYSCH